MTGWCVVTEKDRLSWTDTELHTLFASLRSHVVEVVEGFNDRVRGRVDEIDAAPRAPAPSASRVAVDTFIHFINLLSSILSAKPPPQPPESNDEP